MPFPVSIAPLAALLLSAAPAAPDATALVEKVLQAYGGRAALERHPAVVQEGEVAAHESADVGRLTRIYERPRRLRVTISYPGSRAEQRILDETRGWRDGREVTGTPPQQAMILQAARMDLPLALAGAVARLVDEGLIDRDGRSLHALTLPLGGGLSVTAEIDPASGRIERAVARMPGGPGSIEFVTAFSDFRKVEGTWVAFREESFVNGRRSATTSLRHVEFLPEAPTGAFRP